MKTVLLQEFHQCLLLSTVLSRLDSLSYGKRGFGYARTSNVVTRSSLRILNEKRDSPPKKWQSAWIASDAK